MHHITDFFTLLHRFNGCEITTVVPGGWAERNGVELDDEIYEVGGKLFEPMTRQEKLVKTFIPDRSKLEVGDLTPLHGAITSFRLCKRFSK